MADIYVDSAAGSNTAPYENWTKAATTLVTALAAAAAGDSIWVAHTHAETLAGAKALSSPGTLTSPVRVVCVDKGTASGFTPSNYATTATVMTTGGTASITFVPVNAGCTYYRGITFSAGNSTGNSSLIVGSATGNCRIVFDTCALRVGGTNAGSAIVFGTAGTNAPFEAELINTTMQMAGSVTNQPIQVIDTNLRWRNDVSVGAAITGTAYPTTLFSIPTNNRGVTITLDGLDLSAWGANTVFPAVTLTHGRFIIRNSRLASGATISAAQTSPGTEVIATRVASGATNYDLNKFTLHGSQSTVTNVVRNGGAGDGTTNVGWKIVAASGAKRLAPFDAIPLKIWLDAAATVLTVHGIIDGAAVPKDDECWIEVGYLDSASYPLATTVTTLPTNVIPVVGAGGGASLTTTTEDWDNGATLRAQNFDYTAAGYGVGFPVRNSTAPGKVFFVKTAGTSANTAEPDWSAVADGADVTDGTVTFRAGCRFRMTTASFTPDMAGNAFVYPRIGMASATIYLDPLPVES